MNDLIYLDNAATSHPKPEAVYQAVERALRRGASPGRGSYERALNAERLVFDTREALAELFNTPDSERIIFTANATTAINQALFGLLRSGDRVVTTSIEHNAVTRPLRALQDNGVEVVKVAADGNSGLVSQVDLQAACLEKPTKLLLVNHCSNVFGGLQPVDGLGPWCRQQGIYFMIDGSQTAGSMPIDFQRLQVDLFAAPGHKSLLGPQGTGFLFIDKNLALTPLIYGGTGANSHSDLPPEELPERLECGTFNVPGLAGLHAAVNFLLQTGTEKVRQHEIEMLHYLLDGLSAIDGVIIYGPEKVEDRGAAVSFNIVNRDPAEVGFYLDHQAQIAVRVGLQCAPDAHRTIKTYPQGTVRVSPGFFTTEAELDGLIAAVRKIAHNPA